MIDTFKLQLMLTNGYIGLINVTLSKTTYKRFDLCLKSTFGQFCTSTRACSRNKMYNEEEDDVWKILEEQKVRVYIISFLLFISKTIQNSLLTLLEG